MKKIYIESPQITRYITVDSKKLARLETTIRFEDYKKKVFVEVEDEWADYLCSERSDAFVLLVLPMALRRGFDIYTDTPITENLLHNINEILIPHLVMGDSKCNDIKVHAPTESKMIGGEAVGTGISCGVDSTYVLKEYTNNKYKNLQISHLFIGSLSKELWDYSSDDNLYTWSNKHKNQMQRFEFVSQELGLPVIKVFTNFVHAIAHNGKLGKIKHSYTHHYITMAAVLALKKLWKVYFFASAQPFTDFKLSENLSDDTAAYELLLMHVFSVNDFTCYCGGVKSSRVQKTKELAEFDLAKKILHPCQTQKKKNCSLPSCDKCLRGLLALDYFDKLDSMSAVFDIELYRNNRIDYFVRLVKRKNNKFLHELYILMSEKYPDEMEEAEDIHNKSIENVSYENYAKLRDSYYTALKLLELDDPKEYLSNFFYEKGIKKIAYVGQSKIGQKILSLIEKNVECISFQSNNQIGDAILIISLSKIEIDRFIRYEEIDKPIYTMYDMIDYIKGN